MNPNDEPTTEEAGLDAAQRIAAALESIAHTFAVIADAMLREDDGLPPGKQIDPLWTMDSEKDG
jgi:hypothetical protein